MLYLEVQGIMGVFYLTLLVQTDNHGLDHPPAMYDFKCSDLNVIFSAADYRRP